MEYERAEKLPVLEVVEPVISVRGLTKAFGERVVIEGFNFDIYPEETFAIVGGSGAGKSLSIRNVLHLPDRYPCTEENRSYIPDSGTVYIFGQDISNLSEKELNKLRKRMGYIYQQNALDGSLTVWGNIARWHEEHSVDGWIRAYRDGGMGKKEAREAARLRLDGMIRESLKQVQLDYAVVAEKKPSDISGGERKRVAVAREICHMPEILIGDEVTTGLNKGMRKDIAHLLCDLKKTYHNTLVVITHDDETLPIYGGRIAFIDSASLYLFDDFSAFEGAKADNPAVKKYFDGIHEASEEAAVAVARRA